MLKVCLKCLLKIYKKKKVDLMQLVANTSSLYLNLNLFPCFRYVMFDTPGQIEVFTWSASGTIISETLVRATLSYLLLTKRRF